MKIRMLLSGCLILLSFIFINGCAKDGAIGPKGDKGDSGTNGTNGTNGASGTSGTNGTNGNANVHNYTFDLNISDFIGPTANNSYSNFSNNLSFMGTNFIQENDAVLLYLFKETVNSVDYYNALPFLLYFNTGTAFNQHSFELTRKIGAISFIKFNIRNSEGLQPYTTMSGKLYYKMVTIAGASKRDLLEGVDKRDYYAVCKAFNLKP